MSEVNHTSPTSKHIHATFLPAPTAVPTTATYADGRIFRLRSAGNFHFVPVCTVENTDGLLGKGSVTCPSHVCR